jgi:hypothetical protein
LRGAGNAIVPQVAAEFIRAVMEVLDIAPEEKSLDNFDSLL